MLEFEVKLLSAFKLIVKDFEFLVIFVALHKRVNKKLFFFPILSGKRSDDGSCGLILIDIGFVEFDSVIVNNL